MAYYNDINNIQNERVKLALHNLKERGCISSDEMYQDFEIVIAYILCLEEKIDGFKKGLHKIYEKGVLND